MATRTIESPGVEWNEYDLSQVISYANGTVVVVMGFAHQGPTNQVIEITSKEELMSVFFGTEGPQNAAERYFYHSGLEILNTPGKLLCIRLPYGSGKGSGFSAGYIATAFYGDNRLMTSADAVKMFCNNGTGLTPAYFRKVWENYGGDYEQMVTLINPEPQSFVVSEELYEEIKDGALEDWASPEYDPLHMTLEGYGYKLASANTSSDEFAAYSVDANPIDIFGGRTAGVAIVTAARGLPFIDDSLFPIEYTKMGTTEKIRIDNRDSIDIRSSDDEEVDWVVCCSDTALFGIKSSNVSAAYFYAEYNTISGLTFASAVPIDNDTPRFRIPSADEFALTSATTKITNDNIDNAFLAFDKGQGTYFAYVISAQESRDATHIPYASAIENIGFFDSLVYLNGASVSATQNGNAYVVGFERADGNFNTSGYYYVNSTKTPYYTAKFDDETTIVDALRKSVFFTINKTESSVDKDYAGFYLTVCDQDAFVRRGHDAYSAIGTDIITDATALCLDGIDFSEEATSAYTKANEFVVYYPYNVNTQAKIDNGGLGYDYAEAVKIMKQQSEEGWTVFVSADEETGLKYTRSGDPLAAPAELFRVTDNSPIIPSRMRNFALNGLNSLSQSCVDSLPYVFSKTDFANALHIGVHRFFTNLENDRLSYATLETYTGSLNPESTLATKNGGKEVYSLDRMSENHSAYIDVYMNPIYQVEENVPILVRFGGKVKVDKDKDDDTVGRIITDDVSCEGVCVSLGAFRSCDEENINEYIGNLPAKIDNALLLIDSVLERDIDIVIDGGLSTIWGYTYGLGEAMEKRAEDATGLNYDNTGYSAKEFDENKYISKAFKKVLRTLGTDAFYDNREACAIRDSIYSIFTQFNVFCSKTRKDCIFISDPPRFFFVHGEDTKASSKKDWIFSMDMYHPLKNLYEAANTSYACAYMNWVKKYDNTLADFVWLPMSPFAAAIMCEVDAKYFMWWAPFGLNNGVLSTITDLAFRPNQGQCDYFYKTGFNPVCYFNDGGYVIWGQKTMLDKHSAFDRLNVRRLFLYLERRSMKAMRWFIGEPNTSFTRTQVLETLRPMYDYCVNNSGLYDYLLKCDEENNTPDIIDDNTLVVDIYLKPVRTIEFILLNFYATRTGADFSEIIG